MSIVKIIKIKTEGGHEIKLQKMKGSDGGFLDINLFDEKSQKLLNFPIDSDDAKTLSFEFQNYRKTKADVSIEYQLLNGKLLVLKQSTVLPDKIVLEFTNPNSVSVISPLCKHEILLTKFELNTLADFIKKLYSGII